jgi:hypothetical protein
MVFAIIHSDQTVEACWSRTVSTSLPNEDSKFARPVLDVIECCARDHLLKGKILLCLVQTGDNHYECPYIGIMSARLSAAATQIGTREEWLWLDRVR